MTEKRDPRGPRAVGLGSDGLGSDGLGPDGLGPDGLGPGGLGPGGLGPGGLGPGGPDSEGGAPKLRHPSDLGPDFVADSALERALLEAFGGREPEGASRDLARDPAAVDPGDAESLQFGKYRIADCIGRGGMGEVFAAHDETLQRRVALKSILAEHRLEPQARGRFLREARALSALSHPGICQIHDYVEGPDRDWLVLEWIDGETLSSALLRRGAPPFKRGLAVAVRIADALAAAHAEGIVHRDLKPGNIMVTRDGAAKVLDFGLSRSRDASEDEAGRGGGDEAPELGVPLAGVDPYGAQRVAEAGFDPALTQDGVALGTLPYMSPEQARGESPGLPSDVFSLGLVFQEWFTGRPAYDPARDFGDLLSAVSEARTEPVTGLDRNLAFLIGRMTDPVASRRPTAHGVLRRLRWIQKKPFRRNMWALGIATGVAAIAFGVKYTIDISSARDDALAQREIAEERAVQAERFLLALTEGGLRTKLEEVGRTDVLREFDDAIREYFRRAPAGDLSDVELREHAKSLYEAGETRLDMESLEAAEQDFLLSLEMSTELARRLPRDLDLLYARGQAEFYVGYVQWLRGDFLAALPYLEQYQATSQLLVDLEPENERWRRELSMAGGNLVAFELEEGRLEEAARRLDDLIEKCRAQLADGALGLELTFGVRSDLVDLLGWRGQARFQEGDLQASLAAYQESLAEARRVRADYPDDQRAVLQLSRTLNQAAMAHRHLEQFGAARDLAEEDLEISRGLAAVDPESIEKQRELAATVNNVARLRAKSGEFESALELHAEAVERFRQIAASDPENADYRDQLGIAEKSMGITRTEAEFARSSAREGATGAADPAQPASSAVGRE